MDPTEPEWRNLYRAMAAFDRLGPWEWMLDADLVGVEAPETGITYYCCVMGMAGEHYAMNAYRGTPGLDSYWMVRSPEKYSVAQLMGAQDCLAAEFADREQLTRQDRAKIKQLGLRFRGRLNWPLFRSYVPEYAPWPLESEEARDLATCLDQVVDVAARFRENPRLLPGLSRRGDCLVRVKGPDGWTDTLRKPPALQRKPPLRPDLDRQLLAETARLPRGRHELEVLCVLLPTPVGGEGRPFLPTSILIGEHQSGLIVRMELARPGTRETMVPSTVMNAIVSMGVAPGRFLVGDRETLELVEPIASALRAPIRVTQNLAMREAAEGLADYLCGGELPL
jgi:hypothetical protein